ncbi:uncharacterized protein K02A2.6-like [Malaya genurostris]|uniref:uncharacterized protein K02A2.6-like n=1 Tax=Malaya genurostris TaxID=325434 RepID=UPI0026F38BC6|nr:uncharacterized protein K02A2.6-like [Malaya genurostris]
MSDPPGTGAAHAAQQQQNTDQLLLQILNQQQQLMAKLTSQMSATQLTIQGLSRDEITLDSLASNIVEFVYDPDQGCTFDTWYSRYADLFDKDAGRLDNAAKVRLLMRKLNPAAHERFTSFILPKKSKDFTFEQIIEKLKTIFGSPVSIFHRRYQCLQIIKDDAEDFVSYSCKVNRACVDFKISDLSEEQFKSLIFVCGLKSSRDSDIRMRLITKLNDTSEISLEKVVEECKNLVNLKKDNSLVENPRTQAVVHAVKQSRYKSKSNHKHLRSAAGSSIDRPRTPCWSCGGMHFSKNCQYREHQCRDCKKKGHKEGYCACFSKKCTSNKKIFTVSKDVKGVSVKNVSQRRKFAEIQINKVPVQLQIDSASDITIISDQLWKHIGQPPGVRPTCSARTASGQPLDLALEFWCDAQIGSISKKGLCRVVSSNLDLNILGADWIELFGLWDVPFSSICHKVTGSQKHNVDVLQAQFPTVFSSKMGLCTKTKVQLTLKGDPKPIFRPKRPVAYSMQSAVENEIQRLQDLGILVPVDHSDWAAPIVVVRKPNGAVRICADFSTGLNSNLESNQYPLPLPEDIFAKMAGCKLFSHIDLSDAYLQVEIDTRDQYLLTINTHKGLFRYTRLTPGIKSAPGVFQQLVDTMVNDLNGTCGYLDDILVGGRTQEEHDHNLHQTLRRLGEYGFTVRIEKCSFQMSQIKYLGQILDGDGIKPDPDKSAAVASMPPPHDVPSLRSYLGAVNYYAKYIPEMRNLRFPMDELLRTGSKWIWSEACQRSFDRFRKILQSPLALTHYNPKLDIVVSADASQQGIGARIAHKFPDGTIKAISDASRSLTPAETNYSQIEKEGLALIFAVTRFHRMIFGRSFILETDHKPLLSIFGSKKGIPVYTANRLQRWALTLLLYNFTIQYVRTESFGYADVLSRLINNHIRPNEEYVIASIELEESVKHSFELSLEVLPVTFKMIQDETQADSLLKRVISYVQSRWPTNRSDLSDPQLHQFQQRRDSLSVFSSCLMYGERIVIPTKFRNRVLHQLHKGHPGVERMRSLARNYVYWPGIDEQIAQVVRSCNKCAEAAKTNSKTKLESWPLPQQPWQRVHCDFAGPVDGIYYLIVVDAYSRWPEVIPTKRITTAATLTMFREIFSRHGMPETLITDNGTQFTSENFESYCTNNGILHLKTPPYHPQSNGLAERFVDTFKRTLRKIMTGGESLREAIDTFLLCYRSTPCRSAPEGKTPAELLLGRRLRTSLDLLKPPTAYYKSADSKQEEQFNRKHGTKSRKYLIGESVWAKVHRNNTWTWEPGQVLERVGRVIYNVWLSSEQNLIRSHCNQLRRRYGAETSVKQQSTDIPLNILLDTWGLRPAPLEQASQESQEIILETQTTETKNSIPQNTESREIVQRSHTRTTRANSQQEAVISRHSSRTRRVPVRYDPYHLY